MKLIAGILVLGTTAMAWAQNPNVINNTKSKLSTMQQQRTADSNAALGISNAQAPKSPYRRPLITGMRARPVATHPRAVGGIAGPAAPSPKNAKAVIAVENTKTAPDATQPDDAKPVDIAGRRDPFVSPVVSRAMSGSGCSIGKRCLAIDQINLRGVVKSDDGMIAVVVNALDKAYFLHENDPVFNGYVVRITGDSVVFKETVQDKFGKPFTREVTKKIFTPAV